MTSESRLAGSVVQTQRAYAPGTGRLLEIDTGSGSLQRLTYSYDQVGNLSERRDLTNGADKREIFSYDKLQRLISSTVQQGPTWAASTNWTFGSSSDGNITFVDGNAYTYGDKAPAACDGVPGSSKAGPHAVRTARGQTLCYNANGSVIAMVGFGTHERTLTYSAYELPTLVVSSKNNAKVGFEYGPNRERIRRLDYVGIGSTAAVTVTHHVGNAEVRWVPDPNNAANTMQEVRRYLGGLLIVQRKYASFPSYTIQRQYFLTDAQGSTFAVLDDLGMPINQTSQQSFDAFGARRNSNWVGSLAWTAAFEAQLKDTTRRGYTGHEQVDSIGLIHMNGRIYDPQLARFLQADPFIQDPSNTQSYNRYSYVMNNPMVFTDPTGYWGKRQQGYLRTAAAIVITVWTGGTAGSALAAGQIGVGQAFAITAAGGFAAGALQSGTLRGAAVGAVSAGAFFGVGSAFQSAGSWTQAAGGMAGHAARSLSHGMVGGVMAELQGGRFGHGFASAGVGSFLTPEVSTGSDFADGMVAIVAGGTASAAAGGKFANGAVTASFGFAFNKLFHDTESGSSQAAARPKKTNPGHVNSFFEDLYEPLAAMAKDLDLNEDWILGLSSYESGWYNEHNRGLNNPFGLTKAGGKNLKLDSVDDAIGLWRNTFGEQVRGATDAQDFVHKLLGPPRVYNSVNPSWGDKVGSQIKTVEMRKEIWRSGK